MIDLHTHTNYSDGTWSVKKLLEEAEKAGVEILSITDHDTLKAYKDLQKIETRKIYSGKIISGIEFNTVWDGITFHMLAYDFDIEKLAPWVLENYESKTIDLKKEFDYIMQSCKKNNIKIDEIKYDESMGWPVDVIFPAIKKYSENKKYFNDDEWNDIDVFFNNSVTNKNFPAFVDLSIHYPTADVISKVIREAGGKVFVAHLYKYDLKEPIRFLDMLKDENIIDGVEVYHPYFTDEQSEILEKYCKENDLLMSGGTDCHGDKKVERRLGIGYGNMNISKEIVEEWNK